jgi:hypothetical protein
VHVSAKKKNFRFCRFFVKFLKVEGVFIRRFSFYQKARSIFSPHSLSQQKTVFFFLSFLKKTRACFKRCSKTSRIPSLRCVSQRGARAQVPLFTLDFFFFLFFFFRCGCYGFGWRMLSTIVFVLKQGVLRVSC